jgi:succinate dehydrogenase flavin-adding protein (antitoxin of CptAB toxin-antitoxin module)
MKIYEYEILELIFIDKVLNTLSDKELEAFKKELENDTRDIVERVLMYNTKNTIIKPKDLELTNIYLKRVNSILDLRKNK